MPQLIEGAIMAWVRHLVGKKKRRYIEDGYDLDLTCILSPRFMRCNESPRKPGKGGEGVGARNLGCGR